MIVQIKEEIQVSEDERGYKVILFDNRKGGKDHNVKLFKDISHTFTRIIRNGFVTKTNYQDTDNPLSSLLEIPYKECGFKIDKVLIRIEQSSDGRVGWVEAILRPFGPAYEEIKVAIDNKESLELITTSKDNVIHMVTGVSHNPRVTNLSI